MLSRNERLDRLPVTSKHKRLLLGSGLGWALDAMDVGLISFIMAALAVHWDLSSTQTSWLASAGFLGMALGATFGGLLADKYGRRHVFSLTLLVYGLATGASALASGLTILIVFRFIVGLGLGAELPVASTLISEFSPRRIRGRMVVLLEAYGGPVDHLVLRQFFLLRRLHLDSVPAGCRWLLARKILQLHPHHYPGTVAGLCRCSLAH